MLMRPFILFIACLAAIARHGDTYGADAAIGLGRNESVWSETLGEMRPLQVYLPPGYAKTRAAYPVLYLLDGDRNFLHTVAAVQFLAEGGRIPDTIVVAIANTDRARDLTPAMPGCRSDPRSEDGCGAGDRFLRFLTAELRPWIEKQYRTEPFRILVGHSRGGLFSFDTLFNHPDAFNAYIAISPALWWQDAAVLSGAEDKLRRLPPRRFLYFTDGNESEAITGTVPKVVELLQRAKPENLDWHYAHLANDQHMTTSHRTVYDGLETIFAGLQVPREVILAKGIKGIESHYSGLAARYGFAVSMPMGMLDWSGYFLLQQHKPEMAVAVFQRNVDLYPGEPSVYASLGSALEAVGRVEEAKEAYLHAYGRTGR